MTETIAPPVDDFRVDDGEGIVLRWEQPQGHYEGYLLFSGPDTDTLHQIARLPADCSTHAVAPSPPDSLFAIVTYQGARVSEYAFASPPGEQVGEAVKEKTSREKTQSAGDGHQDQTDPEDARCLECDGELSWLEIEEKERTRRMLKCESCGKRHVRSGDGRILMVDQLHYGCCRCPECEEVHALAMSSDDLIICSKTGRVHAWQGEAGEVDLADV